MKAVEHLLTDREFAPHITAEDLANTIKTVGTSLDKDVTTAKMAREVFGTNWIKLEVIGN
ncbi:hypothetical protein EN802_34255, partial [bacterium M00.F.Ca.ET.159.01.1.1]